jgi:transposase InsO family protein
VGRKPDRRIAAQPRPAARRHRRDDAALPQPQAVAQRHSPLPPAARSVGTPEARQRTGHRLPTDAPAGFIHIDVKYLPPLGRRRSYAYVAIDRATRFVYLEILPDRRGATAAGFLGHFPLEVHPVLTDNGSEFTDRFAVDKKAKPHDKPSGQHPFDRICAQRAITHRLTQPFRPQTNGMVERFNRRLGEHLDRMPQSRAAHHRRFLDHAERDAYLLTFVADYNHTRLQCLDYQAPAELLAKLAGYNTFAGAGYCRKETPIPRPLARDQGRVFEIRTQR